MNLISSLIIPIKRIITGAFIPQDQCCVKVIYSVNRMYGMYGGKSSEKFDRFLTSCSNVDQLLDKNFFRSVKETWKYYEEYISKLKLLTELTEKSAPMFGFEDGYCSYNNIKCRVYEAPPGTGESLHCPEKLDERISLQRINVERQIKP